MFNFSAGPSMLPKEVLQQAQIELPNWQQLGASVMELSHRSHAFMQLAEEAIEDLRTLLAIPVNYKVLFSCGGGRGQFAAIPLNLLGKNQVADYIESGYWSQCARQEATKYGHLTSQNIIRLQDNIKNVIAMEQWQLSDQSAYLHYCDNETLDGLAINQKPIWQDRTVVCDMSSNILSKPIDVNRYGVIYAGAQKNIGIAGVTLLIIRDDLIGRAQTTTPSIFDYQQLATTDSMFNTPVTFAWYISALIFKWLKNQGGLQSINIQNQSKANLLYQSIDNSDFYNNYITPAHRSLMNVSFYLADESLNTLFIEQANNAGLQGLKGHKIVGGMRASIYNAMPIQGVQALVDFMNDFAYRYG